MASGDDTAIDELAEILGKRVVERRERHMGVSRTELAARIGMSQPSLRDIEKGATWPRPWHLRALHEQLAVSYGWLLGDEVSLDEIDVGRWVLSLPESLRQAFVLSARDRPDAAPPPAALTTPRPSLPAAAPAPPPSPVEAAGTGGSRRSSTRTRRDG